MFQRLTASEIFHWRLVSKIVQWHFGNNFSGKSNSTQTMGFIPMLTFKDNDFGKKLETNRQSTGG